MTINKKIKQVIVDTESNFYNIKYLALVVFVFLELIALISIYIVW